MSKCLHGRRSRDCGLCDGVGVYKQHLRSARRRGIPNELSEDRYRWLLSQPCAYCGSEAGGVDRVKSEWGYTTLNSVPCCKDCNYAKQSLAANRFISHAAKIVAHNATYENFKTRWLITRTGGPTCLSSNTTAALATKPTSGFSLGLHTRPLQTKAPEHTALTAGTSSSSTSHGLRRFPSASTARLVAGEHPTHATEVRAETGVLSHSPESKVDAGSEE